MATRRVGRDTDAMHEVTLSPREAFEVVSYLEAFKMLLTKIDPLREDLRDLMLEACGDDADNEDDEIAKHGPFVGLSAADPRSVIRVRERATRLAGDIRARSIRPDIRQVPLPRQRRWWIMDRMKCRNCAVYGLLDRPLHRDPLFLLAVTAPLEVVYDRAKPRWPLHHMSERRNLVTGLSAVQQLALITAIGILRRRRRSGRQ